MFTPPPSPLPSSHFPASSSTSSSDTSSTRSPSPPFLSPHSLAPPTASRPPPPQLPPSHASLLLPMTHAHSRAVVAEVAAAKRAVGRRTRYLSLILVPLALVLVALSTRFSAHPAALDLLAPGVSHGADALTLHMHRRHPSPADSGSGNGQSAASSASTLIEFPSSGGSTGPTPTSASPTGSGASSVPTVPASPPVLPTPFPQPLDSLAANFSSQACANFFANMTQSDGFRACRPFSLLLQSSGAFIQAQDNLTLLNTVLWGTCNTKLDEDTCLSNLGWFANEMQSACKAELDGSYAFAKNTLTSLLAYPVMRQAGCLSNPSTNTYCYLDAVRAPSPSDLYFYSLPLGLSLPNDTSPTCGSCTRSLLALYADALPDADRLKLANSTATTTTTTAKVAVGDKLTALSGGVYERAAEMAVNKCGAGYALVQSGAPPALSLAGGFAMVATLVAGVSLLL